MPPLIRPGRVRLGTIFSLLVLVTIVPLGLFAGWLIDVSWLQQQDLINRQNVERARAISVAVDQEMQKTIAALNVMAAVDPIDADHLERFYRLATTMVPLHPGWQSVRLVAPPDQVLVDTALPFGQTSTLVNGDWVEEVRATGRPAVSAVRQDPDTRQFFVAIGVPVMSNGATRFVLGARVLAAQFSDVLRRQKVPPDGVVSLLDRDLRIVARSRGEENYLGGSASPDFSNAIRSAPEGSMRSKMLEGTPSYSAYSRSDVSGWTIGLGLPAESIDAPIRRSLWALVGVGAAVLGSGLVLGFLVRRRIVRAQVGAVGAARALARGEPISPSQSTVAEFNDLAEGLREAGSILDTRLRERDEAERGRAKVAEDLQRALAGEHAARVAGERNEARLAVTLSSIGDAVIATDADERVTVLNPVAQALTGWSEAEAIGTPIDRVFVLIDERTRIATPGALARMSGGETVALPSTALLIAKDGRETPIGDRAAPIRAADGTLLGIVVVFRDVTAEREAERSRAALLEREQAARRAAETLNRAKDEFVATVSHELRTPLNAIFGWTAMLRMGSLDHKGQAKALEVIDRNTRVQAQLVEDLLDMARVIRGTVHLEIRPLDLALVVDAAVDTVMPTADARRVTIIVQAPRGVALVSGDAGRLQQIVWNLLSNSIKFSQAGDEVRVQVDQDGDQAVLTVHDTGAGIDRAFLPYVFERFRQETSDVTREHAGLGLGLSLVRHLTELHGGTVTAESGGKGQGAAFTVRLPLLGARAGRQAEIEAGALTLDDQAPQRDLLRGVVALVVEDDADALELMGMALEQAGAQVTRTSSVREALAALDIILPAIVITDIAMPHATGFDLMRQLRDEPRWSKIPVVAVTAYARAEDRAQAMALGFRAHVGKPFSPRALVALVDDLTR